MNNICAFDNISLLDLWRENEKYDCAVVTYFRIARDCGKGEIYSDIENEARNRSLSAKLLVKGYKIISVLGILKEGDKNQNIEGFYVVNDCGNVIDIINKINKIKKTDEVNLEAVNKCEDELVELREVFFEYIKKLGEEFEQDSVLLIPKGMDFKSTIDIIIKDINELRDIVDDLKSYPEVPPLQVEIAKSKCRNAVEILELLKSVPVETHKKEPEIKKVTETNNSIVNEIADKKDSESASVTTIIETVSETKVDLETSTTVDTETEIETKKITEELIETFEKEEYFDIEEETIVPEIPASEKIEQIREKRKKEKTGSVIYAERFSSNPNSVYDRLSGTKPSDSSKGRKSSNLFELIGLNDKFLFIREIFNGDSNLYSTAINRLNNTNTFTEANEIILEYVDDEKDEAYQTLVELVKRKFNG